MILVEGKNSISSFPASASPFARAVGRGNDRLSRTLRREYGRAWGAKVQFDDCVFCTVLMKQAKPGAKERERERGAHRYQPNDTEASLTTAVPRGPVG